jgi:streptogramin lyase
MRRKGGIPVLLAALGILAMPGFAGAKPRVDGVFDLSGTPGQITEDEKGVMWVLLSGSSKNNTLARIKPNGDVKEYAPAALGNAVGLTLGGDRNLWATQNGGVVRIPPKKPNDATDFNIAAINDPRRITPGPRKSLWTASGDTLVSFRPGDPEDFNERTIDGMSARGIAATSKHVWIADFGGQRIVRVEPSGPAKKFGVGGGPQEVGAGGGRVLYANPGSDPQTVGVIDGKKIRKTQTPDSDPFGITFTAGKWWVANFADRSLSSLPAKGGDAKRLKLPANSGPRWVATGKADTLWVSLETSEKVARIKGVGD